MTKRKTVEVEYQIQQWRKKFGGGFWEEWETFTPTLKERAMREFAALREEAPDTKWRAVRIQTEELEW